MYYSCTSQPLLSILDQNFIPEAIRTCVRFKNILLVGIRGRSVQKFPITVPITVEIKRRRAIKAVNQRTRVPQRWARIAEFNFLKRSREPTNMISIGTIALENLAVPIVCPFGPRTNVNPRPADTSLFVQEKCCRTGRLITDLSDYLNCK